MPEYIKRETVITKFKRMRLGEHGLIEKMFADGVYTVIENIPAADVAPVVRCKVCKYSCKDGNGRTCEGYWYELSEFAVPVKDDGFCSYGEPKMDGGADNA